MSKKRIEAKEWKRKKKQQKNIQRLVVAAICTAAVLGFAFIGWDMWSRAFVMTFEGQRIPASEMEFFSIFADGTGDPTQQALDHLTHYLLIDQAARRRNISLSEEERAEVEVSVNELLEMFEMLGMPAPNVSSDRMADLLSIDFLTERLMDLYIGDIQIDEAEFEEALEEFLFNHRSDFIDMELSFVHIEGVERAHELHSEFLLTDPDDYNDLILNTMQEQIGEPVDEVPTITLNDLRQEQSFEPWEIHYLSTLPVGNFSEPMQVGENDFIIFVVDYVDTPSDEEISEVFMEEYQIVQRHIAFSAIVEEWLEEADIEVNQRGINAI